MRWVSMSNEFGVLGKNASVYEAPPPRGTSATPAEAAILATAWSSATLPG